MIIHSAIDILWWNVVRLITWDYSQKILYNKNPIDIAKNFEQMWFNNLHIIDLDWAKNNFPQNIDIIKQIVKNTKLSIQVWWWIRKKEDIKSYLNIWVNRIILWSRAISDISFWKECVKEFGLDKLILSLDIKNEIIKINWWLKDTNYSIENLVNNIWLDYIKNIIITDISKDWSMSWVNINLYKKYLSLYNTLNIIPAWLVCCIKDVLKLQKMWINELVIWRALYENNDFFIQLINFIKQW